MTEKCEIRKSIVSPYGEKVACPNPDSTWVECIGSCIEVEECPECGHKRISCYDECMGRQVLCLNPECGMDK